MPNDPITPFILAVPQADLVDQPRSPKSRR